LRERKEDISLIARHVLQKICDRMGKAPKKLSVEAMERLSAYEFPGNIRELENVLERAMIYCENNLIEVADLDFALPNQDRSAMGRSLPGKPETAGIATSLHGLPGDATASESMDDIERDAIAQALKHCAGNRSKAAELLGISRRNIQYKIKRYGLGNS